MTILEQIVAHKKQEVAQKKQKEPHQRLIRESPVRDFAAALRQPRVAVIAEIKRRSPSVRTIRKHIDPVHVAQEYERWGAMAVSVLTDRRFFGGESADLEKVRMAVTLPVLRKEFIVDEYQISESRILGADAILLIARILTASQLDDFVRRGHELGMACLVEVHGEAELEKALTSGASIIGVNSRDLDTLQVDVGRCTAIRKVIPDHCVTVAESGIRTRDDVLRLEDAGFNAVLIGEALLRSRDLSATFSSLLRGA